MILIDTGYLIALIDPADELHGRALEWSRAASGPFIHHQFIVVELLNYFSASRLRLEAHRRLAAVWNHPQIEYVPVDPALHDAAVDLHRKRPDKAWSLTDCVSFIIMTNRTMTQALTYDHHFQQAGFQPLMRRRPK